MVYWNSGIILLYAQYRCALIQGSVVQSPIFPGTEKKVSKKPVDQDIGDNWIMLAHYPHLNQGQDTIIIAINMQTEALLQHSDK